MIGILDLGIGNIRSLSNAIRRNGFDVVVVDSHELLETFTHLIIPGVGHFRAGMDAVTVRDLKSHISDFAISGRPLLGVCVGMQLLAIKGTEGGEVEGLGLIEGTVRRLDRPVGFSVPHVGWNTLVQKKSHPVFDGVKQSRDFYYVHSFALECADRDDVLGETDYGGEFTAVVGRANIVGFQFHPEKSEANGLKLLENFCAWDGRC